MLLIPEININIKNLIYDCGTDVPVIDLELARQRLDALNKHNGPRVGDFVWFPNEDRPRRFTCDLSDGSMQTTTNESNDSSFHITRSGYCDFSGSLDSAIWLDHCHDIGNKLLGCVWFFSRNLSGPHRGVSVRLLFRVYEYWPIKLICQNCQHKDCEAIRHRQKCSVLATRCERRSVDSFHRRHPFHRITLLASPPTTSPYAQGPSFQAALEPPKRHVFNKDVHVVLGS